MQLTRTRERVGGILRWLLMVMAIATAAASAGAAPPEPLDITVAARALKPGELLVFTIRAAGEPSAVEVDLFGRRTPAFLLGDGRWRALVGIDLDQKPGPYVATVEAKVRNTTERATKPLVVLAKQFPTRTLTVSPGFVNPPPAARVRIDADAVFLRKIFAGSPDTRLWTSAFVRPVPDPANSRFGTRSVFNGEKRNPHRGADFASPLGRPVQAPNAGHIVAARELFYTGNVVIIDHGLGVFSTLAHLSRIDVKEGDEVKAGEVVGLVGATGRVTGPHLHWALTVAGAHVDPLSALVLLGAPSNPSPEP